MATATDGPSSRDGSEAPGPARPGVGGAPRAAGGGDPVGLRPSGGLGDSCPTGAPLGAAARAWWRPAAPRLLAPRAMAGRPGRWFGLPWRPTGAGRAVVPLAADCGWVVDTPAVGLPAIPAGPEPARPAAAWQHPGPARPPASAIVGASARRLPARAAPAPPGPPAQLGIALTTTAPGPAPGSPPPRASQPGWRLAGLGALWLALAAGGLAGLTFRLSDAATFATLLTFAALALLTARPPGGSGARDHGLVVVWTLPVALLLPPIYPLVVHLPLSLLRAGWWARWGQFPAPPGPDRGAGEPCQWLGGPLRLPARRRVQDALALGAAGAAASWLHGYVVPPHGSYSALDLTGSPARLAGLAAAAAGFALARALLLPGSAWHWWPRGERARTTAPGGVLPSAGAALGVTELCGAVAVAALWATNPLLMLAAAPPALLLARSLPPDELLAAARTDPKTGLANVTWWRQVADAELIRARRAGRPLSVLLVDIDHFKQVNDRHGHLFGDTVLVAVAEALRAATRPWDLVGRFGGEEFVVLLAEVDLVTAAEIAERIRRQVAAARCPLDLTALDGDAVSVTVSVGAAVCEHSAGLAEALEAADAALYRAKAAGRNRIRVADTAVPVETGDHAGEVAPPPLPVQTAQPD
ncbi:GGDEF domain-containing protein [Pseudofrankia sp. DC12]|uniref:GGDEF domain-containing protein n=1 Tax=Pseudofrankia sp. DC12 TaxID=683315 RepID=UPI001E2FFC01|nr:GGDEF domain-containing protein [Pseudofrankia sp. DC12]